MSDRARLAAVLLITLALYLATLARVHAWDAFAYTARIHADPILSERYLSTQFFHPHHLVFNALGTAWLRIWSAFLPVQDPFLPLQIMMALAGSLSVLAFATLAMRVTSDTRHATVVASAFAVSNGAWLYSTNVEVMMPALLLCLCAALASRARKVGWRHVVLAAVCSSAAVLVHQLAVLAAAALVYLWIARTRRGEVPPRMLAAFVVLTAAIVAGTYLVVAWSILPEPTARGAIHWATTARERSLYGDVPFATLVVEGVRAAVPTFVQPFGPDDYRALGKPAVGAPLVAVTAIVLLAGVLEVVRTARRLPRVLREPEPRAWLLWLVLTAAFVWWFQPWNVEYWVYCVPPLILLTLPGRERSGSGRWPRRLAGPLVVGLLAVTNLASSITPRTDAGRARYARLVEDVGERLQRGDVIVCCEGDGFLAGNESLLAVPLHTGVDVVVADCGDLAPVAALPRQPGSAVFVRTPATGVAPAPPVGYGLVAAPRVGSWNLLCLINLRERVDVAPGRVGGPR